MSEDRHVACQHCDEDVCCYCGGYKYLPDETYELTIPETKPADDEPKEGGTG